MFLKEHCGKRPLLASKSLGRVHLSSTVARSPVLSNKHAKCPRTALLRAQDVGDRAFFPRGENMTTLVDAVRGVKSPRLYLVVILVIVLMLAAIRMSNHGRPGTAEFSTSTVKDRLLENEIGGRAYAPTAVRLQPSAFVQKQGIMDPQAAALQGGLDEAGGRRVVRNATIEMIVAHPAEVADQITILAEKLGGYLVSADGAGQNATFATVAVRVPAAHFEEARAEIRELGLRVDNEKFDAQDVTQQYVDQEASIRNLQAEELQYLEILRRANDVNSMLMVSGKLSEVRGKIEKQQAEFNSLAHQAETVAIAVSLRTELEQQVFGLDWRPLRELKVAANNGLESLANYATAMMTILFYLPAVVLWLGTILTAVWLGWRAIQWVRRRWLGWTAAQTPIQG
jgi:hypothetical protein